jgi:hypothetical protein
VSTNTATTILAALNSRLTSRIEMTLYGRAALQLGFSNPPEDFAVTRDVDAVLWIGQAEELLAGSNFWEAVEATNAALQDQELFISHFFGEDQVILRDDWKSRRVRIAAPWEHLDLFRLADVDLLLSKLMRDDPIDHADARFIVAAAGLTPAQIKEAIAAARIPDSAEIREQFALASRRLLAAMPR